MERPSSKVPVDSTSFKPNWSSSDFCRDKYLSKHFSQSGESNKPLSLRSVAKACIKLKSSVISALPTPFNLMTIVLFESDVVEKQVCSTVLINLSSLKASALPEFDMSNFVPDLIMSFLIFSLYSISGKLVAVEETNSFSLS